MTNETLFKMGVYSFSLYCIYLGKTEYYKSDEIAIVGILILLAHIYKDYISTDDVSFKWPKWTEPIGIILGIILIRGGYYNNDGIIFLIGSFKVFAHIRQLMYNNDKYYDLN